MGERGGEGFSKTLKKQWLFVVSGVSKGLCSLSAQTCQQSHSKKYLDDLIHHQSRRMTGRGKLSRQFV